MPVIADFFPIENSVFDADAAVICFDLFRRLSAFGDSFFSRHIQPRPS